MRTMRLSLARLGRGFRRRDGTVSGHVPQPELQSSIGKYSKDYANLPERYVIRKSTELIYKSEKGEWSTPPQIELTHLMHHATERPWSFEHKTKYGYKAEEEYEYIVEPIRERDWMWFRGDRVEILSGKDKGKQGYINFIVQERNWVTVEGLNLKYTIENKSRDFPGVCRVQEMPLLVTEDIALVDPTDEQPAEFSWQWSEEGERVRVSNRTGYVIPKPAKAEETYDYMGKTQYVDNKHKDTTAKDVESVTFVPKLATFEMDIMQKMGIKEDRVPKKSWWY